MYGDISATIARHGRNMPLLRLWPLWPHNSLHRVRGGSKPGGRGRWQHNYPGDNLNSRDGGNLKSSHNKGGGSRNHSQSLNSREEASFGSRGLRRVGGMIGLSIVLSWPATSWHQLR